MKILNNKYSDTKGKVIYRPPINLSFYQKLLSPIKDEKYLKIYGELVTIAHQNSVASIDNFTNP